jgi:hypothetical protein
MLDGVLLLWYLLTAGSLVFLVWDLETNTPAAWMMKIAWVLVVLYTGPVGLFVYLLSCRQPQPGTHDRFIAAPWKQAVGSLMHCVAGDATGIILAAGVAFWMLLPKGIGMMLEYAAGFAVGLLVFQALFKTFMTGGSYWSAVRQSFFPEAVSMNMVMAGMLPVKALAMQSVPGSDDPLRPTFWGIMGLATMAGPLTAYPINSWMVRHGIKHGMMSAIPDPAPMASMSHGAMAEARVPSMRAAALIGATALVFLVVMWLTSLVVRFRLA